MQPQNDPVQYSPVMDIPTPPKKGKNKPAIILATLLVLILAAGGAGVFVLTNSLKTKDKELDTTRTELDSVKGKLTTALAKIQGLDNPQKKTNDEKRKSDLATFIAGVDQYAANHNGTFPSTEPSFFVKDFEKVYITGKLDDFTDPDTKKPYTITPVAAVQTPPGVTLGNIQYQWPGKCSGSEFEDITNERHAAARLVLESGEIYCLDS